MLMIRLQRVGKRNNPAFRVVLTDKRNATKSGSFLEILGSYNPQHDGSLSLKKERVSHWLSKGTQTSDTIHNLLVREKIIDAPKRSVVAPSKFKKPKAEKPEVEASAEPVVKKTTETAEKIEEVEPVSVTEAPSEKKE